METECISQRCITKGVSIITVIVEYNFVITQMFLFFYIHSIKKFVAEAFQTIPDNPNALAALRNLPSSAK